MAERVSLIRESARLVEADPAKRQAVIDIVEAGPGNRRDRRIYSAENLPASVDVFVGAKMFADHLAPEDERKLKGMPRSIRDLTGRITEAWWNPEGGTNGSGSIQGRANISAPWLWSLIEHDPELIGVSINAVGRTRRVTGPDGEPSHLVEAITACHSVDWVAQAGAGGRVVDLLEAYSDEEEDDPAVPPERLHETQEEGGPELAIDLKDLTKDELRKQRPDLVSAIEEDFTKEIDAQLDALAAEDDEEEEIVERPRAETPPAETPPVETPPVEADDDDDTGDDGSEEEAPEEEAPAEAERELATAGVKEGYVTKAEHEKRLQETERRIERRYERLDRVRHNRVVVSEMLVEAGLPPLSQARMREDFHDFAGPEQELQDAVRVAIREKKAELAQVRRSRGVVGLGNSRMVEGEGRVASSERAHTEHTNMMDTLGLNPEDKVMS